MQFPPTYDLEHFNRYIPAKINTSRNKLLLAYQTIIDRRNQISTVLATVPIEIRDPMTCLMHEVYFHPEVSFLIRTLSPMTDETKPITLLHAIQKIIRNELKVFLHKYPDYPVIAIPNTIE